MKLRKMIFFPSTRSLSSISFCVKGQRNDLMVWRNDRQTFRSNKLLIDGDSFSKAVLFSTLRCSEVTFKIEFHSERKRKREREKERKRKREREKEKERKREKERERERKREKEREREREK